MAPRNGFRHHTPAQRIYSGEDCLGELAGELRRLGSRRAVILCGGSMLRSGPALARVQDALGDLCAGVCGEVRAHSPLPAVLHVVEALRTLEADAIVSVGGGSAIVTGRAAAILLGEDRPITELCTRFEPGRPPVSPKLLRPKLPQIAVPTTPTTASAKAGSAVLDVDRGQRLTMFDPKTRAQAIFFDPVLAGTAPRSLVLDAALNGLAMAIQGLEAPNREPLADALLLHAVRLFADHLPALSDTDGSAETRSQLMTASLLSGQGTDYTAGGLTSVLSYCIGARFRLPNGITNAILLPHGTRFNAPVTGDRLDLAGAILNGREGAAGAASGAEATAAACAALFASLGVPAGLRDLGISQQDLYRIAADAGQDWFLHQVPRRVEGSDELVGLLRSAW